jgi:hypothetical protein
MKKLKTKDQLLSDFKKANKVRRLVLANRAGFDTPEEYRLHLVSQIAKDATQEIEVVEAVEVTDGAQPLDMVIAFDTTGSMRSYLGAVKKHIVSLLGELFFNSGEGLRIKIVSFGDYCDMQSATIFGKAYQETDLTNNQNDLINFVNNAENTSGGDGDEFYELVLQKVADETQWRDHSKKVLFLVGDADPHRVGYSYSPMVVNSQINWRDELQKFVDKDIAIDTLNISGLGFYKTLSDTTNGVHIPFRNAGKLDQIIRGTTYARTSHTSFTSSMDKAVASGDSELIGAYKTMSTLL